MAYLLAILSVLIGVSAPDSDSAQHPWRFVHITDAHVGASGSLDKLKEIVAEINAMDPAPEFVIDTGDLTEFGAPSEWKAYADAVKGLSVPFYAALGNHDTRWSGKGKRAFEELFGPPYYSFDSNGWHFVVLDTSIRFDQHGYLDPDQLEWLRADLAAQPDGTPLALACHHPPKFPERSFMEGDDALFDAIGGRSVILALTGHGHSFRKWKRDGVQLLMTKAVMDSAYRIIEVGESDVRTYIKWVGKSAALDTITPLQRATGDEIKPTSEPLSPPGAALWSRNLGSGVQFPIFAASDRVVVPTLGGRAVCLDIGDGSTKWEIDLGSCAWAPERVNNDLILSSESGKVARVAPETGTVVWEYGCPGGVCGGVGTDGDLVCFVDGNGCLRALDAATGIERWQLGAMGPVEHPPAISEEGIYLANWASRVFRISRDGSKMWEFTCPSNRYYSAGGGRLAVSDGLVVACCAERKNSDIPSVFALKAESGELAWGARTGGPGYCSPAIRDKEVYVTNLSGNAACLELNEGEIIWTQPTGNTTYSQHPALGVGKLVCSSLYGKVSIMSAATGSILSRLDPGFSDTYCLSSLVVADGRVIVAAMDGTILCLKGGQ